MSERVSTAVMWLGYAVETTAGERPITGYKVVPEVKSMPSFNPAPETIDSTTLAETEWMTFVEGLKNPGGALEYGANLTDDLYDFWEQAVGDYDTAFPQRKTLWWCVCHPKLKFATYYTGKPSPLGINEAAVGAMAETTLYITPTGAIEHGDPPTTASGANDIGV